MSETETKTFLLGEWKPSVAGVEMTRLTASLIEVFDADGRKVICLVEAGREIFRAALSAEAAKHLADRLASPMRAEPHD